MSEKMTLDVDQLADIIRDALENVCEGFVGEYEYRYVAKKVLEALSEDEAVT